jgi:DNA-binding transcriptional LysR family regulator
MERLDAGRIDFGLFVGAANTTKYESAALPAKDEWGVLMRRDDRLASLDAISPQELAGKPLILSRQALGEMEEWFSCSLDDLNVAATFNLLYNACALLRSGMGYAVSLRGIVPTDGPMDDLAFRPLEPGKRADLSVAWRRHQALSPASKVFLDRLLKLAI